MNGRWDKADEDLNQLKSLIEDPEGNDGCIITFISFCCTIVLVILSIDNPELTFAFNLILQGF